MRRPRVGGSAAADSEFRASACKRLQAQVENLHHVVSCSDADTFAVDFELGNAAAGFTAPGQGAPVLQVRPALPPPSAAPHKPSPPPARPLAAALAALPKSLWGRGLLGACSGFALAQGVHDSAHCCEAQ